MPQSKSKRSRYTPPAPKKATPSKLWVPVTMFTCLVLGVVVIGGNYLQLLPGGEASNNFLRHRPGAVDCGVRFVDVLPIGRGGVRTPDV